MAEIIKERVGFLHQINDFITYHGNFSSYLNYKLEAEISDQKLGNSLGITLSKN